jgi:rhamnogalacturonan hydrolase
MFMIKSNGGSGTVKQCSFTNFIGHKNAYSLDIDSHWPLLKPQPGNGVLYQDLNFTNWKGTCLDGFRRGPINVICPDGQPCTDITISDFAGKQPPPFSDPLFSDLWENPGLCPERR